MSRPSLITAVALALTLGPGPLVPALGGQVHEVQLSIEQLLGPVKRGHATLALVTIADPERDQRTHPLPPVPGKTCEPVGYFAFRARVDRVVRAADFAPALAAGDDLTIVPANVPELVELAHRECLDGTRKSPIWPRYPGARTAPGAQLLVVLGHREEYGWLEHISGAWLLTQDLERIVRWLDLPSDAPLPPR